MKVYYRFILFLLYLCSCQPPEKKVVIYGKVTGEIPAQIAYTNPINGVCNWQFTKNVEIDSSGSFSLELGLEKASFIKFKASDHKNGTLIAEPGKTYHILFDLDQDEGYFSVSGNNKKLHLIYNDLPDPEDIQVESIKYIRDTVAKNIKVTIEKEMQDQLTVFENLYGDHKITEAVYNLLTIDRKCYYGAAISTTMWIKYMQGKRGRGLQFTQEFDDLWYEIHHSNLIDHPELNKSPWFNYYAKSYIYFRQYQDGTFMTGEGDETPYTFHTDNAKKYLPAGIIEDYLSHYLHMISIQKSYEKELISLYNDFSSQYLESAYLPYISPNIEEIVEFYQVAASGFKENVKFIEGYQDITTLSEAVSKMDKGNIYIDV
ncbi:MAG: hypothetical protein ACNS62_19480, partial [Candidatus Cyclobacteriaceae bacterium M3_2C_046]